MFYHDKRKPSLSWRCKHCWTDVCVCVCVCCICTVTWQKVWGVSSHEGATIIFLTNQILFSVSASVPSLLLKYVWNVSDPFESISWLALCCIFHHLWAATQRGKFTAAAVFLLILSYPAAWCLSHVHSSFTASIQLEGCAPIWGSGAMSAMGPGISLGP